MIDTEGFAEDPRGRIWYRIGGSGSGVPLLCVHGGPGVPSDYLVPLFDRVGRDRPVVIYDQIGGGRSSVLDEPSAYSYDSLVAEVEIVRATTGLQEFHLYGQSFGSSIAAGYAKKRPSGLRSVTFSSGVFSDAHFRISLEQQIAAMPEHFQEIIRTHELECDLTWCPEFAAAAYEWDRRHFFRLSPWPKEIHDMLAGAGPLIDAAFGRGLRPADGSFLKGFSFVEGLESITEPTLFMNGRFDQCAPEWSYQYAAAMPDARVSVFERSSHYPHLEEPAAHDAVFDRFLRDVDARMFSPQ